jgi:fumarate reductase subunit D
MNVKRSNEPVVWLLFAGGGMVAALMLPAILAVLVLLLPLDLTSADALSYDRIAHFSESIIGRMVWLAIIALPAWHALHRIFHLSKDVRFGNAKFMSIACYGSALVITISVLTLVIAL